VTGRAQQADELSIDNAIADVGVYSDKARYHALFATLRREDPVRWTTPDNYRPFWTVAKHADISEVQKQPGLYPSGPRTTLNTIEAEEKIFARTGRRQTQRSIISTDGAEHTALRTVTQEWLLPDSVKKLEDDIAALARHFVDKMSEHGGACDFVEDIAVWYPLRVILLILGLKDDPQAEKTLLRLSKEMNGSLDKDTQRSTSQGEHMLQVVNEIFDYFRPIAEDRRKNPRDDLASVIANAKIDGKPMDELTVFSYYLSVAVAGHDTTSASTAGGLLALIQNPEEMAKLRAKPSLIRIAVNEMVRWTHPVKHFFRTAAQDTVLRGRNIKAGDSLLMCYPSGCRDEEVFKDPFNFRVDRASNPHLAFGIGPHVCLGQYLAKVEMAAFYRELIARVADIRLDGEPVESQTLFMGGLKRLPIRYSMIREPVYG
jgi:cytochrome P450